MKVDSNDLRPSLGFRTLFAQARLGIPLYWFPFPSLFHPFPSLFHPFSIPFPSLFHPFPLGSCPEIIQHSNDVSNIFQYIPMMFLIYSNDVFWCLKFCRCVATSRTAGWTISNRKNVAKICRTPTPGDRDGETARCGDCGDHDQGKTRKTRKTRDQKWKKVEKPCLFWESDGFPSAYLKYFYIFLQLLQEIQEILATVSVPQCHPQRNHFIIFSIGMSQDFTSATTVLPLESLKFWEGQLYALCYAVLCCALGRLKVCKRRHLQISKDVCRTL